MSDEILNTTDQNLTNGMDETIISRILQRENIVVYSHNEFEQLEEVAAGSHGTIFKAELRNPTRTVVLKPISLTEEFKLQDMINEIKQHQKLEYHYNILRFYGITRFSSHDTFKLVVEYADGGSLRQYLETHFSELNWNNKLQLAKEVTSAVMCLHVNGIVHGHLDSENILVQKGHIRLSDLGISRRMAEFSNLLVQSLSSFQYMDPQILEILLSIGHKRSSDIYSLGVLLWEISSGRVPFESEKLSNNELIKEIVRGKRETVEQGTPRRYAKIYKESWQHDDTKRPTVEQVYKELNELDVDDVITEYEILMSILDNLTKDNIETNGDISDTSYVYNEEYGESSKSAQNGTKNNTEITEIDDTEDSILSSSDIKIDVPPEETFVEIDYYIKGLFQHYVAQFNMQHHSEHVALMVRNYMEKDDKNPKNPTKVFAQILQHPRFSYFTSLVGFFYRHGVGTLVDYEMAFEMYSLAVDESEYDIIEDSESLSTYDLFKRDNQSIGQISLGLLYYNGLGLKKDEKKAFQIFMDAAENGSSWAQSCIGYCYNSGRGVDEKDDKKALEWNHKSANNGNLVGQCNLGYCFQDGLGVELDEAKGFQLYLQSAQAGNIEAGYVLAHCYENGKGVEKNEKLAFDWYLKLGESGYDIAQCDVGYCYHKGIGVEKNDDKAFQWYSSSAANDYAFGQLQVGKCHKNGLGTQKDILKMFHWLTKARDNGEQDAEDILQDIIDRMI
ncbi:hypothetical protein Glove_673g43 [Diversispora epigaea]|uniref:Protein kinase domain-containing protein n=1 Tax=Diversispora epigaea TaxID=1348612 RepID=A0A397GBP0_9GLOM|nr:hypothetical protein Glove_673g43 [Diversispora epigaea]